MSTRLEQPQQQPQLNHVFSECLQRLSEVERSLASLHDAETAVADVRRLLTESYQGASQGFQQRTTSHDSKLRTANNDPCMSEDVAGVCSSPKDIGSGQHLVDQVLLIGSMGDMSNHTRRQNTSNTPGVNRHRCGRWLEFIGYCNGRLVMPVLHPDAPFLIAWDLSGLLFILWEVFALPFYTAFDAWPTSGNLFILALFINAYFIVDIGLNFLRGYRNERHRVVLQHCQLAKKYLRFLPWDVMAGIPWDSIHTVLWNGGGVRGRFLVLTKLLRLVRIVRLVKLLRQHVLSDTIEMLVESNPWLGFARGVVQVLLTLFSITHWAACVWFFLGDNQSAEQTWTTAHVPSDAGLTTRYIYSVYFTLTTMTTVGYGDITPTNPLEMCFVSVLLGVATVVFASLMGALTDLIFNLQSKERVKDERMRALSHYLSGNKVPRQLFQKVRHHMSFLCSAHNSCQAYDGYEAELKEQLTPALWGELCYHNYQQVLKPLPFLAWLVDYEVVLQALASAVLNVVRERGDIVFRIGQPLDNIVVLRAGSVRLSLNESLFHVGKTCQDIDNVEENDVEDEDSEEDTEMRHLKALGGNCIPKSGFHELVLRAKYMKMQDDQCSNFSRSKAVWQAIANMRNNDLRLQMSASYIQKKWQDRRLQKRQVSRLQACIKSRTVKAPAYFGESSIWLPLDEWDVAPVHHTYGARCMQCCELLLIPKEKLQQLIHDFSPWLRQRFEAFRADVVAAQASALHEQTKASAADAMLRHEPKTSCQGKGDGRCFGDSAAVGAVDAVTHAFRGRSSSIARTDSSADAESLSSLADIEAARLGDAGNNIGPVSAGRRLAANKADSHSPCRDSGWVVGRRKLAPQSLQTCPALPPEGDAVMQARGGRCSTLKTPLLGEKPWHISMTPRVKQ